MNGLGAEMMNATTGTTTAIPALDIPGENIVPSTNGWAAYTYWTNSTGKMFKVFSTEFTVPAAPVANQGTVFLFPGIQNMTGIVGILQPVLQWGSSAAGGGDYWAIANWWVQGSGGHTAFSHLARVNSGTHLTGVMSVVSGSGNSYTYNSVFSGHPAINLQVQNIPPLVWFNETLESYGISNCSGYPPNNIPVKYSKIHLTLSDGTHPSSIPWTKATGITACDEHAVVVSTSATSGEVAVYF